MLIGYIYSWENKTLDLLYLDVEIVIGTFQNSHLQTNVATRVQWYLFQTLARHTDILESV